MIPTKPVRVFATVAAVCLCMIVGLTAYAEKDKEKDKKNDMWRIRASRGCRVIG